LYLKEKMKKLFLIRFGILILGASLLAACGQAVAPSANPVVPVTGATSVPAAKSNPAPATGNSASTKVEACVLLPKEDVSAVLGQPVGSAESKGGGDLCSYTANNISVDLTVLHSGGTKYLQQILTKLGSDAVNTPGIGDQAFYNPFSYSLIFRKGDSAYMIFLLDTTKTIGEEDRQAKEKGLAMKMLSHLP
jgi:hypothetical protein